MKILYATQQSETLATICYCDNDLNRFTIDWYLDQAEWNEDATSILASNDLQALKVKRAIMQGEDSQYYLDIRDITHTILI